MSYLRGEYAEEFARYREQREAWYACDHPGGGEIRRRVLKNGTTTLYRQCPHCGESMSSALSQKGHTREEVDALPPYDETLWAERQREKRESIERVHEALLMKQQAAHATRDTAWWHWYNEYLASPEWRALRQRVFDRAGGYCEGCGVNAPSQIHHLTYKHVGNEFLFELAAVCGACHERLHDNQQEEVGQQWKQRGRETSGW